MRNGLFFLCSFATCAMCDAEDPFFCALDEQNFRSFVSGEDALRHRQQGGHKPQEAKSNLCHKKLS